MLILDNLIEFLYLFKKDLNLLRSQPCALLCSYHYICDSCTILNLFLYAASPFRAPFIFLNSSTVLTTFSYISFLDVCSFLGLDRSPLLAKVVYKELFSNGIIKFYEPITVVLLLFMLFPFIDLNRFFDIRDVYEVLSPEMIFGCPFLLDSSHRSITPRLFLLLLVLTVSLSMVPP